jgi:cation-transporting P-type ATPase E
MGAVVADDERTGLTDEQARTLQRAGEANTEARGTTRSYTAILRTNVFTFYNTILFTIGVVLLALGRTNDAFITVGIGLVNAVISSVQEVRAKRKLDQLQLLEQAQVVVVRAGRDVAVARTDVVRGDLVRIRAGEQIVVDGPLLPAGEPDGARVEVDESLLTGESDLVLKRPGDPLRSGSLCAAGSGLQRADAVGAASYASRLTADARQVTTDKTPLQRRIEFLVRLVMVLTALMSGTILAEALMEGFSLLRIVQITAVLSGLVPYGLFFLIGVAYAAGAVAISRQGALVQQINAVESLSNVDVVCTDKTGTLTTGRLTLTQVQPLGGYDEAGARAALARLAATATSPTLTMTALQADAPGDAPGSAWLVHDEVPFTSAQRWSGAVTDQGSWVLGAPEALSARLDPPVPGPDVAALTAQGLRVLVLGHATAPQAALRDADGRPALPELRPVAVVALADELRPHVAETIAQFTASGVGLKVLSGDDPRTVAALATQAGMDVGQPVAGAELDPLDDGALDELVERTAIFGRVAPEQKERIVSSLRRQEHYVAMIGDGVNDARALKRAQVGVAMRSGSAVTRGVADIVLLDDSFAALLPAQREGRRIINGITVSLYVYLVRVATQGLVILSVAMLGLGFPYSPTQVGLTLLTVGAPTLFLTFWASPAPPDPHLLGNLARFVLPASVITAAYGVGVYAVLYQAISYGFSSGVEPAQVLEEFENYTGLAYTDSGFAVASSTLGAQTGLSTFVSLASFLLILFLFPPNRFFTSWTSTSADRRPTVLVAVLIAVTGAVLFIPATSSYFGLTGPAAPVFVTVFTALALWFVTLSLTYRFRVLDRALGLDALPVEGLRP